MRKGTKKLKMFEQFEPETTVTIDVERLNGLIDRAAPVLDEIGKIISQEEDRTISIEMFNRITSALEALEELKSMY